MKISPAFRQSIGALHTWSGVSFGALLFAIFWMGTLSVFDAEIDQWMKPELRVNAAEKSLPLDQALSIMLKLRPEKSKALSISPVRERQPLIEFWFRGGRGVGFERQYMNPESGELIKITDSLGGKKFIYPFHQSLHLSWNNIGRWLVGFAAMSMLVSLISGILSHRKILAELFVFRPEKSLGRSTLDLHTLLGLVALPFCFLICVSGLIISMETYLPWATSVPFNGDKQTQSLELKGSKRIESANKPDNTLASLDQMVAQAEARWSELDGGKTAKVDAIRLANLGDENSYVRLRRIRPENQITMNRERMIFDASSGEILHDYVAGPVVSASNWIKGMHYVQFNHWLLRWLYFLSGLAGCVLIATGQIFWERSRIKKQHKHPLRYRLIRALSVGSVAGIIAATGMFLVMNRLLTSTVEFAGYSRSELEVTAFFVTWVFSFIHAAVRHQSAWKEQFFIIATITVLAPALNWITTGDHLIETLSTDMLSIFSMDILLLLIASIATLITVRLRPIKAITNKSVSYGD